MATTGRYIEANGPRVYCKAYGEDEVLGRPGVSKELGRFNSTFTDSESERSGTSTAAAWPTSRSRSRAVKSRSGKGHPAPRGARQPDGTQPPHT